MVRALIALASLASSLPGPVSPRPALLDHSADLVLHPGEIPPDSLADLGLTVCQLYGRADRRAARQPSGPSSASIVRIISRRVPPPTRPLRAFVSGDCRPRARSARRGPAPTCPRSGAPELLYRRVRHLLRIELPLTCHVYNVAEYVTNGPDK